MVPVQTLCSDDNEKRLEEGWRIANDILARVHENGFTEAPATVISFLNEFYCVAGVRRAFVYVKVRVHIPFPARRMDVDADGNQQLTVYEDLHCYEF